MKSKFNVDSVYDPGARPPPAMPPPAIGRSVRPAGVLRSLPASHLVRRDGPTLCGTRPAMRRRPLLLRAGRWAQGKAQYTTSNVDTSDMRRFLMEPGPKNGAILCHIRREKGKLGYPYYALYLEARMLCRHKAPAPAWSQWGLGIRLRWRAQAPGVTPVGHHEGEQFLLSARKRKKSKTSNYLISTNLDDTSRQARPPVPDWSAVPCQRERGWWHSR